MDAYGIEAINALELVRSAQTCSLRGLLAAARAGRQSITLNWKCLRDLPRRPPGESDVSAKVTEEETLELNLLHMGANQPAGLQRTNSIISHL
jgi:hypothetical protein